LRGVAARCRAARVKMGDGGGLDGYFAHSRARESRTPEPCPFGRPKASLVWQRDELDFIARHFPEMTGFPFGFGLLDAFLPGRNKIPPDVPRAIHRCAPEDDKMRVG